MAGVIKSCCAQADSSEIVKSVQNVAKLRIYVSFDLQSFPHWQTRMELRSTFEGPSEIPASCPPCWRTAAKSSKAYRTLQSCAYMSPLISSRFPTGKHAWNSEAPLKAPLKSMRV